MIAGYHEYYLFSQRYRMCVEDYYGAGIPLNKAIDYSKCRRNHVIAKTMEKLRIWIRYVEKDFEIAIMDKTIAAAV